MPTADSPCTVRSMRTVRRSDCAAKSSNPEINDTTDDFTVEQVRIRVVDVVEAIAFGDHLVEHQLPSLIEPGQPVDVRSGITGAEHGACQVFVHQNEVL